MLYCTKPASNSSSIQKGHMIKMKVVPDSLKKCFHHSLQNFSSGDQHNKRGTGKGRNKGFAPRELQEWSQESKDECAVKHMVENHNYLVYMRQFPDARHLVERADAKIKESPLPASGHFMGPPSQDEPPHFGRSSAWEAPAQAEWSREASGRWAQSNVTHVKEVVQPQQPQQHSQYSWAPVQQQAPQQQQQHSQAPQQQQQHPGQAFFIDQAAPPPPPPPGAPGLHHTGSWAT